MADRVAVLYAGRIVEIGTASRSLSPATRPLYGGSHRATPSANGRSARFDPRFHAESWRCAGRLRLSSAMRARDQPSMTKRPDLVGRPARRFRLFPSARRRRAVTVATKSDLVRPRCRQQGLRVAARICRACHRREPAAMRAVDAVSFSIRPGEIFGLVGESGCGKSTLARVVAGLDAGDDRPKFCDGGRARPRAAPADDLPGPFSSLNGRWRVGRIVAEPIRVHHLRKGRAVAQRVVELLEQVGLSASDALKYPHEFSGGQRQRISIARALAGEPDFLILDEPTSALDVSVQAQILNLLKDLQRQLGLTCLFITHNLGVVRMMADRVGVMYLGQIVELGEAASVFAAPRHPYTRLLLDAAPDLDTTDRSLHPIEGELPSPANPPLGMPLSYALPACARAMRRRGARGAAVGASLVKCHFPITA